MATVEVKLPDIGEGVNEGEIVRWLVKEGDVVAHDQPLVEVMTDKATVEIPCSSAGKVVKLSAKEGQIVKIGGALLTLETSGAQSDVKAKTASSPAANAGTSGSNGSARQPAMNASSSAPSPTAATSTRTNTQTQTLRSSTGAAAGLETDDRPVAGGLYAVTPPAAGENVLATPATRRYARELGIDLNVIKGTGPAGRVTREDVVKTGTQGTGAVAAARPQFKPQQIAPLPLGAPGTEERKPFRGIRRKIAENLVHSKQVIPHFTHADECDVTELVKLRAQMKEAAAAQGVKLTYLPIIVKALIATCREFPQFNASIDDAAGEVVYKHTYNVGFAADTPEGLLVPNIKNAESKSILQIGHEISDLAEKARAGKLGADDMRHGTITITNIGSIGGVYATPIINHPEVAIIGVYKIQKKAVVINDEVKIRDMMGVTATCDHRLVDGAAAARFLNSFMRRLENPQTLLFDMV